MGIVVAAAEPRRRITCGRVLCRVHVHLRPQSQRTPHQQRSVDPVAGADAGSYDCVITNPCGTTTSNAATLTVGPCPSDLDDGSGTGTPDGGVDINDLLFFLTHYEAGC